VEKFQKIAKFVIRRSIIKKDIGASLCGWGLRILGAGCGFLTFRQLFVALGPDGVAAIAILQSIGGWISILEIGTGFVAQNYIVKAKSANLSAQRGLRLILLRPMYIGLAVSLVLIAFQGKWVAFVVAGEAASSLKKSPNLVVATTAYFLITNFATSMVRILYAEGKVFLANLIPVLGSVLNLITILCCSWLGVKSLNVYVFCLIIPSSIPLVLFAVTRVVSRKTSSPDNEVPLPMIREHYSYSIFNMAATLVLRIDVFVLSRVLNTSQLVTYVAVQKLFSLIVLGPQTMLATVHPRFSAMYIKGQYSELRTTALKYGIFPSIILLIAALFLMYFDRWICPLITAGSVRHFGFGILSFALIYYILRVWTDSWATCLLAANKAQLLLLPTIVQGLVSAPFLHYFGGVFGDIGGFIGLILAFLLTTSWWAPRLARKEFPATCPTSNAMTP